MSHKFHVLLSPLNWGLGHASRMIPLIECLLDLGCKITIAACGGPLQMLQDEFSRRVDFIDFPVANIRYSGGKSQTLKLAGQIPFLLLNHWRERRFAPRVASAITVDMIISDNRYGFKSSFTYSVFVTHQLWVKLPQSISWMEKSVNSLLHKKIRGFDSCLVPDNPSAPGLSGELSHATTLDLVKYIGPVSRFQKFSSSQNKKPFAELFNNFILVLLSGPEPQRIILEKLLEKELEGVDCIWFKGIPGKKQPTKRGTHWVFDHADSHIMAWAIENSRLVVSRSGYSTVMDLSVYGKKCVFIPTPGQTEQEYLAQHLQSQGYVTFLAQEQIPNLKKAILQAEKQQGLPKMQPSQQLREILTDLIAQAKEKRGTRKG